MCDVCGVWCLVCDVSVRVRIQLLWAMRHRRDSRRSVFPFSYLSVAFLYPDRNQSTYLSSLIEVALDLINYYLSFLLALIFLIYFIVILFIIYIIYYLFIYLFIYFISWGV